MNRLSRGKGELAQLITGSGFYKLGYVARDREAAIRTLSDQLGYQSWKRFDPSIQVRVPDGSVQSARLHCAFSMGLPTVVEVMEPIDGAIEIFEAALRPVGSEGLAFHHVGVLVDDFEAATATLAGHGILPAWTMHAHASMKVSYSWVSSLGHYLELVQYDDDGAALQRDVRSPTNGQNF
ncbi:VOC family protein [Microbacterium sp. A94]|uniref:VOC family protein n=1 Tax=Microbacterium sp. A94 TaxID=3450717 RepID=UPI003F4328A5